MSDYLIPELEHYGVAVRDRSEVAELHGTEGELDAVTLLDGERLALSFLFLFLGAVPCTDWLGDTVERDDKGFILTGSSAGASGLLETSVPGIYAAGDVRAGSVKRCATAVGVGRDGRASGPRPLVGCSGLTVLPRRGRTLRPAHQRLSGASGQAGGLEPPLAAAMAADSTADTPAITSTPFRAPRGMRRPAA